MGAWRHVGAAASEADIAALRTVAPPGLPEDYYAFLKSHNGLEGEIESRPYWLQLYPADEVARIERQGTFQDFFPGLFVIGGNGGGEAIAFDLRNGAPYPLVFFDMVNIDLDESIVMLAVSFEALGEMVGLSRA